MIHNDKFVKLYVVIITQPFTDLCVFENVEYTSNTIHAVTGVQTWKQCKGFCWMLNGCEAWTLTPNNTCYLKNKHYLEQKRTTMGMISGPSTCGMVL